MPTKTTTHGARCLSWPTGTPKPLSAPPLTDAPSDGPRAIRWIENNLVFGEGDRFGEPVRLEWFQKIFLTWLFELRPDGRYRYRRAYLETPKGNGKTNLAAWIAAYQLAHQFSAVIPVVASSYDQAELVFGDLRTAVAESPTLRQVMAPFEGEVQVKDGPSRGFKVPAVAGVNDGLRPSTAIFDEVHEFVGPNRERVHLVIGNGCAKRAGSLQLNFSTPGFDMQTLAGKLHQHGLAVNSGEIIDDEYLFVWWGCPADRYDLGTDDGRRACIRDANPASASFLNVADVAARYRQIPQNEWLRYHAGLWVSNAQAWLPAGAWDSCAAPGTTIPDGAEVVLGFDGSVNNDSTAIAVVSCAAVPHIDVCDLWERPERAEPDWAVPIEAVEQALRDACRRWKVREIVADPFRWARSLQLLADEGLPVVEFPQTASRMTPATARFYEAVMNKAISHSGDARLARHLSNACLRVEARGQRLVKETKHSARKIDLAIAAVMALDRASAPVEPDYDILQSVY
jgi:phage terminase large subunit-like protein